MSNPESIDVTDGIITITYRSYGVVQFVINPNEFNQLLVSVRYTTSRGEQAESGISIIPVDSHTVSVSCT